MIIVIKEKYPVKIYHADKIREKEDLIYKSSEFFYLFLLFLLTKRFF